MTKQPLTDEQRLILRFERARDEAPMSEPEARALLGEVGVDVDAEFKLLMEHVRDRDETARLEMLANAEVAYRQALSQPRMPARRRSRTENQAAVRSMQARHPRLSAHHHDLTHMSDDDLASLVEQLEELEAGATEE
ncbi:MAG: hypothetical protein K8W52_43650 [Deltaproteobacteria bacterium]|nr:hypothetical protein [Deltaproteobacteria bacterium]